MILLLAVTLGICLSITNAGEQANSNVFQGLAKSLLPMEDHTTSDSGDLVSALLNPTDADKPCESCTCGCDKDIQSWASPCTTCNKCRMSLTCCEPPPPVSAPFRGHALSQRTVVTPVCFEQAKLETQKLIEYTERLTRGAQCTKVYSALESLLNYAQLYSLLFRRNANRFLNGRAPCARPVLRIHEAIVATISETARFARILDYNIRMAGRSADCQDASRLLIKTAQTYVRLLGAVMGKVSNYLCKTEKILKNDPFLRSADDVALLSLQLVNATSRFFTSPSYCFEKQYLQSLGAFSLNLDALASLVESFETSDLGSQRTALALIEHDIILFAYEAKVNTSDNYGGYNRIVVDDMGPALEIGRAFKRKDLYLRNIANTMNHMVKMRLSGRDIVSSTAFIKDFTDLIQFDVQLFELSTKVVNKNPCNEQFALELQLTTQLAIKQLDRIISSNSVSQYEAAMRLALYTTEYAVRAMTIADFANADELLIDTGLKELHEVLSKSFADDSTQLQPYADYVRALKTIVEVPACNEKCMPAGHFGLIKPILNAMTIFASKMGSVVRSVACSEALKPSPPPETSQATLMVPNPNQVISAFTEEFIKSMRIIWDILYRKRIRSCVNHECFVRYYSKFILELGQTVFTRFVTHKDFANKVAAARELLSAEINLLDTFNGVSHPIKQSDRDVVEKLLKSFQRAISDPDMYKQSALKKIESLIEVVENGSDDCYMSLKRLLRVMKDMLLSA